ncbi:hypothetical protein [Nitrospirillum viridazoti]|uniref:Uncharacterized protein n=1 Tax=Nitrospirillum amazonense TaxID=28077 RepID=A0A560IVR8_9PROT|nr:hypothetical protein [Nitrospirillum amazonense]TWB62249.1 hypothetical protein FBZ92_105184 [Nitrospirillum amazonense]
MECLGWAALIAFLFGLATLLIPQRRLSGHVRNGGVLTGIFGLGTMVGLAALDHRDESRDALATSASPAPAVAAAPVMQEQLPKEAAPKTERIDAGQQKPEFAKGTNVERERKRDDFVRIGQIGVLSAPAIVCPNRKALEDMLDGLAKAQAANDSPGVKEALSGALLIGGCRPSEKGDVVRVIDTAGFLTPIYQVRFVKDDRAYWIAADQVAPAADELAQETSQIEQAKRQLQEALKDPEKVALMECLGIKIYEDPQPAGHPPSAARCREIATKNNLPLDEFAIK